MTDPTPFGGITKHSTVDDFLKEVLKLAMQGEGMRLRGATVMGNCVFRYTLIVDEIELATNDNPETKH